MLSSIQSIRVRRTFERWLNEWSVKSGFQLNFYRIFFFSVKYPFWIENEWKIALISERFENQVRLKFFLSFFRNMYRNKWYSTYHPPDYYSSPFAGSFDNNHLQVIRHCLPVPAVYLKSNSCISLRDSFFSLITCNNKEKVINYWIRIRNKPRANLAICSNHHVAHSSRNREFISFRIILKYLFYFVYLCTNLEYTQGYKPYKSSTWIISAELNTYGERKIVKLKCESILL